MKDSSQIPLPLSWQPLFEDHHFFVGNSNRAAFLWINTWPWPHPFSCIFGEKGSGKTHLGVLWSKKQGALWITEPPSSVMKGGTYVFEGMPQCSEEALFFFYEAVHHQSASCLFLAREAPARWPLRDDIRSRLATMPCIEIGLPEDDVLDHVLQKCFHDFGLHPSPSLRSYLIQRMPRSFDTAQQVVEKLHTYVLHERCDLTRALAQRALEEIAEAHH